MKDYDRVNKLAMWVNPFFPPKSPPPVDVPENLKASSVRTRPVGGFIYKSADPDLNEIDTEVYKGVGWQTLGTVSKDNAPTFAAEGDTSAWGTTSARFDTTKTLTAEYTVDNVNPLLLSLLYGAHWSTQEGRERWDKLFPVPKPKWWKTTSKTVVVAILGRNAYITDMSLPLLPTDVVRYTESLVKKDEAVFIKSLFRPMVGEWIEEAP